MDMFRVEVEPERVRVEVILVADLKDFHNARRRHSACDGMSSIDYERLMAEARRPEAA